ncbi:MAG: flagellar basal body P-ring formation chaperone FlgA [bacterium]|nr:flagellar basal body P-ring formation chaperone FlgA [bacterium]
MKGRVLQLMLFLLLLPMEVVAGDTRPLMIIPSTVKVSAEQIILGDVAQITLRGAEGEAVAEKLKAVSLGASPAPGQKVYLPAQAVLKKIENSGVATDSIGYSIPQSITVIADRIEITKEQVSEVVRQWLYSKYQDNRAVRSFRIDGNGIYASRGYQLKVDFSEHGPAGRLKGQLSVIEPSGNIQTRELTITIDDWQLVPVAKHNIERGQSVSADDLELLRFNLREHAPSVLTSETEIIGQTTITNLRAGQPILAKNVAAPLAVAKGKKVILVYENGFLRATAAGIAQEDGRFGDRISVQNSSSRKVLAGVVSAQGQVRIEANQYE